MAWKRSLTETLNLPSGNTAVVREVEPAAVILANADSDAVPEWLINVVIDEFKKPGKTSSGKISVELTRQNLPVYARFIDLIVRSAMVSPRIVSNPNYDLDEIALGDVKMADKMAIFAWAMPGEEFAAAEKFPGQPEPNVEPVPASGS